MEEDLDYDEIAEDMKKLVCPIHHKSANVVATANGVYWSNVCCTEFKGMLTAYYQEQLPDL